MHVNTQQDISMWDYRIVGINIKQEAPANAKKASEALESKMSSAFIEEQFPEQYERKTGTNLALQCQKVIQLYGRHGWEHYQQGQLGNTAILYFRRAINNEEIKDIKVSIEEEAMISSLDPQQRP